MQFPNIDYVPHGLFMRSDRIIYHRLEDLPPLLRDFMSPSWSCNVHNRDQVAEIAVRYEQALESHSERERLHHEPTSDRVDIFQTGHPTSQSHHVNHHSQSSAAPRQRDDMWDMPVLNVGQNNIPPPRYSDTQSFPRHPESQPQSRRRGSVSIPVIHEVSEPVPPCERSCPSRTSPNQGTNTHDVPTPQDCCTSESAAPTLEHKSQEPTQPSASAESLEGKSYEIISGVLSEVQVLEERINTFQGVRNSKEYRYIEEMLTRSLLKLDSVESGSNESVRQAKRKAVRSVEAAIKFFNILAVSSEF